MRAPAKRVKLVDKHGDLPAAIFYGRHGLVSIAGSHLKTLRGKINNREGDNNSSAAIVRLAPDGTKSAVRMQHWAPEVSVGGETNHEVTEMTDS